MSQDFSSKLDAVVERLKEEFRLIRTGRANADLVSNVMVESYGSHTPLSQLASISTPDATTIAIQPWDSNILKDIEKAISKSDQQFNPVNDGAMIRITLPALTEERRTELAKIVAQKGEEARVKIKQERESELKGLKQQEKDKTISEDDYHTQEKSLQAEVDKTHATVESLAKAKTEEIMSL